MSSHAWGFDVDETITAAPKQYANLAKALRKNGDTVHVITGHGPADLRADLLDLLGFEYDELAVVDPGEDGLGKAIYCAAHNIYMMFDNNTDFGPAISAVCPVTFQYHEPAPTPTPPAPVGYTDQIGRSRRRHVTIIDGPHAGEQRRITGLTDTFCIGSAMYHIDGDKAFVVG